MQTFTRYPTGEYARVNGDKRQIVPRDAIPETIRVKCDAHRGKEITVNAAD